MVSEGACRDVEGRGLVGPPPVTTEKAVVLPARLELARRGWEDQLGVLGGSLWLWTVGGEGEISKSELRSGGDFRKARKKKSPY